MKCLSALIIFCLSLNALFASPFAPDPSAECVVYSRPSSSPLHVAAIRTNDAEVAYAFPASYTGHRAACAIPNATTNDHFKAWSGGGTYTPGDPFGVTTGRDARQLELTETSAIVPRIDLWGKSVGSMSDRAVKFGPESVSGNIYTYYSSLYTEAFTPDNVSDLRVRIVRTAVDWNSVSMLGVYSDVVYDSLYNKQARQFLIESDVLSVGMDLDWDLLYTNVVTKQAVQRFGCNVTNVTYVAVLGNGPFENEHDTNIVVTISPTYLHRRFESTRTVPTPISAKVSSETMSFSWRLIGEDAWASQFGTTYTAFKIKVFSGSSELWNSGIRRLNARDGQQSEYVFKATTPSAISSSTSDLSWRVAVYNAKFRTDELYAMSTRGLSNDVNRVFSPLQPITRFPTTH